MKKKTTKQTDNSDLSVQKRIKHPDGIWWTSSAFYNGCEIVVKACKNKGMKAHCFKDGKVVFTHRFRLIDPQKLLTRIKNRIDLWQRGEWTPKKLKNEEKEQS